ncbi:hypothetical protein AB1Y20_015868 [Prymnesium parvum]|uniref:FHA domain-containing protein n=1 Tax=Prymnesium parvum TaxID=97485 RepID=A0AB34JXZ2_PRYPA
MSVSAEEMERSLRRFARHRSDLFDCPERESSAATSAPRSCWDGHTTSAAQMARFADGRKRAKELLEAAQNARLDEMGSSSSTPAARAVPPPETSHVSGRGGAATAAAPASSSRGEVKWHVIVKHDGVKWHAGTLSSSCARLSIGRHPQNGVRLDSLEISKRHARLQLLHGLVFVKDCGSTHGTWLDGRRLTEDDGLQPLPRGGRLLLGHVRPVTLRVSEALPSGVAPMAASRHRASPPPPRRSMFEMLGGDEAADDVTRLILSYASWDDLCALRLVDRRMSLLCAHTARAAEWRRRPDNAASVRLAMWRRGAYEVLPVGSGGGEGCLSLHGGLLARGDAYGGATVCRVPSLAVRLAVRHACRVTSIAVREEGEAYRLATGGLDGVTRLWLTGGEAPSHSLALPSAVRALAWAGARAVVSGSDNGAVRLWGGGAACHGEGHVAAVRGVAADEARAVTCSDDRTLQLWSLEPFRVAATLRGHCSHVAAVAMRGDTVASGGAADPHLRLWDVRLQRSTGAFRDGVGVPAVALGGEHELLASSMSSSLLHVIDLRKLAIVARLPGHATVVRSLATDDGERFASRDTRGSMQLRQLVRTAPGGSTRLGGGGGLVTGEGGIRS